MRFLAATLLAIGLIASRADVAWTASPLPSSVERQLAITYSAPAGLRGVGPLPGLDPFRTILPSGRIVTPVGQSVLVGSNAFGLALTPDGKYALVSEAQSVQVVDVATMHVVEQYSAQGQGFFVGVVALHDPRDATGTIVFASDGAHDAVRVFTIGDDGLLVPQRPIAVAGRPSSLVPSADGTIVYVVDNVADTVGAINVRTRSLAPAAVPVGFGPLGAALAGDRLLVANEGLMRYSRLSAPAAVPPLHTVVPDLARASSLSVIPLGDAGALPNQTITSSVPMDPTPDGLRTAGGAHPSALATTEDGNYAFVAMANVDRIASVDLQGSPRVVGGTELRLFDRGPYGTQPDALALSRDGKRLYVALAGLDAVAVVDARDPVHLHRLGLIPTGWFPSALALSDDQKSLFVLNAGGNGEQATLQRIELDGLGLFASTKAALADARAAKPATRNALVPQTILDGASKKIKHVVVIVEEDRGYDALLGDLTSEGGRPHGIGLTSMTRYGEAVTPNLHALARRYALAGNLYADGSDWSSGHAYATAGIVTAYSLKTALGPGAPDPAGQDPEDYPRMGSIFTSLARHGDTYRDYGDLLDLAGYADDPLGRSGLGGTYAFDVPGPAVLAAHLDLNYPGLNPRISNVRRAQEFVRDYRALVSARHAPAYAHLWLPGDAANADASADGDRALGIIIDYLSHSSLWRSTAIFIAPTSAGTPDHISPQRTYALVVSPWAKRQYVGRRHLSTVSVLKTTEELLGLSPLSLGDLLASDMADFFTSSPDFAAFSAVARGGGGLGVLSKGSW
jgi:DNA-binding beta-propeller fold protein YncE